MAAVGVWWTVLAFLQELLLLMASCFIGPLAVSIEMVLSVYL